jgi:photosystem II stability/assembly factor-like uncharacterized protein
MTLATSRSRLLLFWLLIAALPALAQSPETRFGVWSEIGAANLPGRTLDGVRLPDGSFRQLTGGGVVWSTLESGEVDHPLNDQHALRPLGTRSALVEMGRTGSQAVPRLVLSADRPAGVHYSDDNGASWQAAVGLDASGADLGLEAHAARGHLFHLRQVPSPVNGQPDQMALHASVDRGASFARIALLPLHSVLDSQPAGNAFYVLRENLLVETNVLGDFLSDVGVVPIDFAPEAIRGIGVCAGGAGGAGAQDHVWAFYRVDSGRLPEVQVYRSLDGGRQWQRRASISMSVSAQIPVQCSAGDPAIAFVGGERAWRTLDGGQSWQPVTDVNAHAAAPYDNLPVGVYRIRSSLANPSVEVFLFATSAGLYVSGDAGRSVSGLPGAWVRSSQYASLASRLPLGDEVYAAARDGGYQRLAFITEATPQFGERRAVGNYQRIATSADGSRVWLAGVEGVWLDSDPSSPSTSRLLGWSLPDGVRATGELLLVAVPGDHERALLGGVSVAGIPRLVELRHVVGAIDGLVLEHRFTADAPSVALATSPHEPGQLYVADAKGRLHRSDDGGRSFVALAGGNVVGQDLREIVLDPSRPGRLLVAGSSGALGAVRESLDDGATFHDLVDGLTATSVNALSLSADGRYLFAATADGPWFREPATGRWRHIGAGQAPDQDYRDVEYIERSQRARFATDGRGVWQVRLLAPATPGIPLDEPQVQGLQLPTTAQLGCPAGFYVASVDDGPAVGVQPGSFGLEVLLDDPVARTLTGGLNFGGLIDAGQPGFAGISVRGMSPGPQSVRLELRAGDLNGAPISLRVRVNRRTALTSVPVYDSQQELSLEQPFQHELLLGAGFYEVTVSTACCSSTTVGGAPEAQFYFGMTTGSGPGFDGGAVVGGYHADIPGLVSGFAAFCLADPNALSMRTLSAPTYGPAAARDLRLNLRDGDGRSLLSLPAAPR